MRKLLKEKLLSDVKCPPSVKDGYKTCTLLICGGAVQFYRPIKIKYFVTNICPSTVLFYKFCIQPGTKMYALTTEKYVHQFSFKETNLRIIGQNWIVLEHTLYSVQHTGSFGFCLMILRFVSIKENWCTYFQWLVVCTKCTPSKTHWQTDKCHQTP